MQQIMGNWERNKVQQFANAEQKRKQNQTEQRECNEKMAS